MPVSKKVALSEYDNKLRQELNEIYDRLDKALMVNPTERTIIGFVPYYLHEKVIAAYKQVGWKITEEQGNKDDTLLVFT